MGAAEIARFLPGLVRRETSEEAEAAAEAVEEIEVSGTRPGEPTGETTVVGIEVSSSCSLSLRGDAQIFVC